MIDGNEIWEALFSIMKGNVPDEMTPEVCDKLARHLAMNALIADSADEVDAAMALIPEGYVLNSLRVTAEAEKEEHTGA